MKIETPVKLDAEGDYVDAAGTLIFIGSVCPEPIDAEVVRRINLFDGLVRALRVAVSIIPKCDQRDAMDAMLNLAGGIVDITSTQVLNLATSVGVHADAARAALIAHDGDPIMAELLLRRAAMLQVSAPTDVDLDAIGWAYRKLHAFCVHTAGEDNALMMDRLNLMLLDAGEVQS